MHTNGAFLARGSVPERHMPRFRPIPWLWLINPTQARFCIETCTLFKERQTFRLDQDVYRLGTDYGLVERNRHYRCQNTQIVLAYYFVSYGWRAGGGILVDASSVGRPVGATVFALGNAKVTSSKTLTMFCKGN